MGHRPRILVCEHEQALAEHLSRSLEQAGFWVDIAQSAREALHKLESRHYRAMTLNLLLADQDALSLSRELRVLGLRIPILVISVRAEDDSALQPDIEAVTDSDHPEPDWVRKAADQARAIFAIKAACQRLRGFRPRILHVESDRFSSGLVKAALNSTVDLVQASAAAELDHALDEPRFDLALLNPTLGDLDGEAALHRIAALCPDTPVVMHTNYALRNGQVDLHPSNTETGPSLITALRTLMLHGMQVPLRAQA